MSNVKNSASIPGWAVALAVVLVLGLGAYFLMFRTNAGGPTDQTMSDADAKQLPSYMGSTRGPDGKPSYNTGNKIGPDGSVVPVGK